MLLAQAGAGTDNDPHVSLFQARDQFFQASLELVAAVTEGIRDASLDDHDGGFFGEDFLLHSLDAIDDAVAANGERGDFDVKVWVLFLERLPDDGDPSLGPASLLRQRVAIKEDVVPFLQLRLARLSP